MFQLRIHSIKGQRGAAAFQVTGEDEALEVLQGIIESVPGAGDDEVEITRYNSSEGRSWSFASVNGPHLTPTFRASMA